MNSDRKIKMIEDAGARYIGMQGDYYCFTVPECANTTATLHKDQLRDQLDVEMKLAHVRDQFGVSNAIQSIE